MEKYNLPINQQTLLRKLHQTQIISSDSCDNYSFCYQYLYYFFVAKFLSEHIEKNKQIIKSIINNLHKDENAYIALFISHHSKNNYILDEIVFNGLCLFEKFKPATLSKKELSFFDEQGEIIAKAVLPPKNLSPEKIRDERLKTQDVEEQVNFEENEQVEENDDLAIEFRRSIKTVEVMGRIIKNRAGSLEKPRLELIFEEAMKINLRILTSFFDLIRDHENQQEIVDYISNRLNKIVEEKADKRKKDGKADKKISIEELKEISKKIFWNTNFFFVYSLINKIIHSVGSNQLTAIVEKVCDKENTPSSFLVKHGILMWFNKNLQIDNISDIIEKDGFSETAKKMMRFLIVNHCSMHTLNFKDKQRIEHKFGIPSKRLLIQQVKHKEHE